MKPPGLAPCTALTLALAGCALPATCPLTGPDPVSILPEPPASPAPPERHALATPPPVPEAPSALPAPPPPPAAAAPASPDPSVFTPLPGFKGAFVVRGVPAAGRVTVQPEGACALTREGSVWCWRWHDAAAPGRAGLPFAARPAAVAGLHDIVDLSASGSGLCAAGASVRCLGDPEARRPPAGLRASAISSAQDHDCAVRGDGQVVCWGNDDFGQLGAAYAPGPVTVPGVRGATEVSAGSYGSCAVEGAGTLVCWGAASLTGWAPGGAGFKPPSPTPPTALRGVRDVSHVSLRGGWPCLLRKTGRVLCWLPEDASTLLPTNPLPADSEVEGITDGVGLSGPLVVRRGGEVVEVTIAYEVRALGKSAFKSRPLGAGALVGVVGVDGSAERGCAVSRTGEVICWSGAR